MGSTAFALIGIYSVCRLLSWTFTISATEAKYQLIFDERRGYLYARISAPSIDAGTAIRYLAEIGQKCNEIGCSQLMLVRDIPAMLNDTDLFFTTSSFQQMMGSRKVALVNPYREIREDMKFAVVIGLNRGGQFNFFDTEEEAERWLAE